MPVPNIQYSESVAAVALNIGNSLELIRFDGHETWLLLCNKDILLANVYMLLVCTEGYKPLAKTWEI
jgi:hypothetical protein